MERGGQVREQARQRVLRRRRVERRVVDAVISRPCAIDVPQQPHGKAHWRATHAAVAHAALARLVETTAVLAHRRAEEPNL